MRPRLEKIVLYPGDELFDAVRDFYHETLELEYTSEPSKYWVEFETGGTPICMHHNDCYKDEHEKTIKRRQIIFRVERAEEVYDKHRQLQAQGYSVADIVYPTDTNRLGAIMESPNGVLLVVRDPMGNDVRLQSQPEPAEDK